MVPLSERDSITRTAKGDAEMRAIYALIFSEPFDFENERSFPHWALLRAIAKGDQTSFATQVTEFRARKTSATSGWYNNDCLVFLLLLGCERFQYDRTVLDPILAARDRNLNPTPKRVNEIFRALRRSEYRIEGELAFIKINFFDLAKPTAFTPEDAEKIYRELTRPGLLQELSPFLQLLALRAFDLLLFHRQPKKLENFSELVSALETYRQSASVRQAVQILWAMPYKWLLAAIGAVLMAISVAAGWAQHYFESSAANHIIRPSSLQITSSYDALQSQMPIVRALAQESMPRAVSGEHYSALAIESSHFTGQTPKFSIEVSTQVGTILEGQALLINAVDGGFAQTIVPTQVGPHSTRSFLPPSSAGSYLISILIIKRDATVNTAKLVNTIDLRPLD